MLPPDGKMHALSYPLFNYSPLIQRELPRFDLEARRAWFMQKDAMTELKTTEPSL